MSKRSGFYDPDAWARRMPEEWAWSHPGHAYDWYVPPDPAYTYRPSIPRTFIPSSPPPPRPTRRIPLPSAPSAAAPESLPEFVRITIQLPTMCGLNYAQLSAIIDRVTFRVPPNSSENPIQVYLDGIRIGDVSKRESQNPDVRDILLKNRNSLRITVVKVVPKGDARNTYPIHGLQCRVYHSDSF